MDDQMRDSVEALSWIELLQLVAELAADGEAHIALPIRVLRQKARAGEVPSEAVPLLSLMLREAQHILIVTDLAKALAALGRDAVEATPVLIEQIRKNQVRDDLGFWALDGCLHALGFIGDQQVRPFLDELERTTPSPVHRAGTAYSGKLDADERALMFTKTVARVRGLLDQEPGGRWCGRRTEIDLRDYPPTKAQSPLATRLGQKR